VQLGEDGPLPAGRAIALILDDAVGDLAATGKR
jgi:hypothetical protein